ncbi:MAG TPA: hypothetical protein VFI31_03365 [Pirellulales bacterium]|nr:hypothetical protein [Pirellulales bacterium]
MFETLDIFFGDANNAEARVYARLEAVALPAGCRLTGHVVGPTCEYSRTLPAKVPFAMKRNQGPDDEAKPLLVEAIVPDPCFWSQELPFIYRAEIELRVSGELLAAAERTFGIRPLGARGRRLVWEGRPWMLRAADAHELPERSPAEWRTADLAMLVEGPGDDLCREASRLGAVLIADLTGAPERLDEELRRLSRWPAVILAILDAEQQLGENHRAAARNLLLAQRLTADSDSSPVLWASLLVCEEGLADAMWRHSSDVTLPIVVQRPGGWCDGLDEARRQCDLLQRDLAGRGDFAGLLI